MNSFNSDFIKIWDLIESDIPFAYSRYADGEIALIQGKAIQKGTQATDIDNWSCPNQITKLGIDLKNSLRHEEDNYFYAICCDCCDSTGKKFLLENIKQKREYITYSNLWINSNYKKFIEKIKQIKKPINLLCNQNAKNKNFPFLTKTTLLVPNDCVSVWENESDKIKEKLRTLFLNLKGETFFISVGPMSEVIIDYLWSINSSNQYIDVGSALDEYVHGRKTRPYMHEQSEFYFRECMFI